MNNLHKSGYSSQDSYDLDIEKKDMLGQIEKLDKVSRSEAHSMLTNLFLIIEDICKER